MHIVQISERMKGLTSIDLQSSPATNYGTGGLSRNP